MKTTILSGSSRPDNKTIRLAHAIQNQTQNSKIVDFKGYDIPFPNGGDVDPNNLSPFQSELIGSLKESLVVFVLTPEYNWFPSAELVNMVHQLANRNHMEIFNNKVFAFCGVSSGGGGRLPIVQLSYMFDKILNVFNMDSVTSPKKFEARYISSVLDEQGNSLGSSEFDKGLKDFIDYTYKIARRWH
ncbi:MAG: NAD(P)H-dependent oxidoreductase [Flavobacteriales bacterium]|nr:NAD(P)H-dependent oxidoreductase [Flavobacteriales bacterium]